MIEQYTKIAAKIAAEMYQCGKYEDSPQEAMQKALYMVPPSPFSAQIKQAIRKEFER